MFKIPIRLRSFIYKYCISLIILMVCALFFYIFNHSYFSAIDWSLLFGALKFQISTLSYVLSPLFLLHLAFFIKWNNRVYQAVLKFLFHLLNSLLIILNCIDFEYFKFTFKRSSSDLLQLWKLGEDVQNQIPQLLLNFWYLFFIALFLILLSEALYRKFNIEKIEKPSNLSLVFYSLTLTALLVIGARGGFQLKPLSVIQSGQYASAQNIPLVLNTPFTVIKSLGKSELNLINYYTEEEVEQIYSPIVHLQADGLEKKLNVVLLILEGFSSEYIGFLNEYEGYTPFLDSLMSESLVFTNAFANGKKSIESLPAILSGIPALADNPYISSSYSGNKINSLPQILMDNSYQTFFFHGGANGTMGFDAYSRMAGIEHYYGLSEYPNAKDHYDGNWGIFDEEYLQYVNKELSKVDDLFFSGVFTLSSHHPYTIPKKYEGHFNKGSLNIHESVSYADLALRKYFQAAKQQKYYENTLFVLVADHTAQTEVPYYQGRTGMYRVPLVFHHSDKLKGVDSTVSQQSDIFPSVLDYLNIPANFVCFGNSVFDKNAAHFAVNYLSGVYQYIEGDYALLFDGEEVRFLYNYKEDPHQQNNLMAEKKELRIKMLKRLKAIIQQYNYRMLNNALSYTNQ